MSSRYRKFQFINFGFARRCRNSYFSVQLNCVVVRGASRISKIDCRWFQTSLRWNFLAFKMNSVRCDFTLLAVRFDCRQYFNSSVSNNFIFSNHLNRVFNTLYIWFDVSCFLCWIFGLPWWTPSYLVFSTWTDCSLQCIVAFILSTMDRISQYFLISTNDSSNHVMINLHKLYHPQFVESEWHHLIGFRLNDF